MLYCGIYIPTFVYKTVKISIFILKQFVRNYSSRDFPRICESPGRCELSAPLTQSYPAGILTDTNGASSVRRNTAIREVVCIIKLNVQQYLLTAPLTGNPI